MTDTAKSHYLAAVQFEADKLAETEEIRATGQRIHGLRIAAKQRQQDAQNARDEAETDIKSASLEGRKVGPETREVLSAAKAVIDECTIEIAGFDEELERLDKAYWAVSAEVMEQRRHLSRLREGWHREAAGQAISKMVNNLPDGVPVSAIAAHLECAVYRLQQFVKG
jgi:hypothetical protein